MHMNPTSEQRHCRPGRADLAMLGAASLAICLVVGLSLLADTAPESETQPSRASRKQALLAKFNVKGLTLDPNEIHAGGPDKDGIPSLTDPNTLAVGKAKFAEESRIVVVTVNKQTRGYPLPVLNWHEAVNDVLGDVPIAVVYCPLCDSVSVVDRRIGESTVEFGISGLLHNSNVLLYDRKTDALWSQLGLEAVSGPHVGKSLKHLPWQMTTFMRFAKDSPEADVLSRKTGHRREYARNPYAAYFRSDRLMFPIARRDDRLDSKTRVVGVKIGDRTRAYPLETIRKAPDGRLVDKLGSSEVVLKADGDTVSVVKVPEGAPAVHTFWFAWAAFHPETSVHGRDDGASGKATRRPHAQPKSEATNGRAD